MAWLEFAKKGFDLLPVKLDRLSPSLRGKPPPGVAFALLRFSVRTVTQSTRLPSV